MSETFPVELLGRFLYFLAVDGESKTWQKLAYLATPNSDLFHIAKKMERPLVVDVEFDEQVADKIFVLPFAQATFARIEIHWGDGSIDYIDDPSVHYARHSYARAGQYRVHVWPLHQDHAPPVLAQQPFGGLITWISKLFDARRAEVESMQTDGGVSSVRETGGQGIYLDHFGWARHFDSQITVHWWKPLRAFKSLGGLGITSLSYLFSNSQINIDLDGIDMSTITNLKGMFAKASHFNHPSVGEWDVSNVTTMSEMFYHASSFDQSIEGWNVTKVRKMKRMFYRAVAFNQPLDSWDVSNAIDMSFMFFGAASFNQPLNSWTVNNVTTMYSMFCEATAFNQPLDHWKVEKVKDMSNMFYKAASFKQRIGKWRLASDTAIRSDASNENPNSGM